jgi:polysaccharide pyruvyl transferase CsaB
MRITVAGWIGSTNLGDEFVFAGVRRAIQQAFGDADITALSINPDNTRETHGVSAVHANDPLKVTKAVKQADLVVFGGGGLIQHETSPFNLPYHLSRTAIALMLQKPVVALGLGVSPITAPVAKRLVPLLARFSGVTVRDVRSQAVLHAFGVDARVACDMAWHVASPLAPPEPVVSERPRVLLALRPWDINPRGRRSLLPVSLSKTRHAVPYAARLNNTLGRLDAAGYAITALTMQPGRDDHVYDTLDVPFDVTEPTVETLLDAVSQHDVMVAMRYHAGVAATMARMPSVLIGYSDKVTSLAENLHEGARHLPFAPDSFSTLDTAISDLLKDQAAPVALARARQQQLALKDVNVAALKNAVN